MTAFYPDIGLAHDRAQIESGDPDQVWILCPWLAQLPAEWGVWLSVLAAHDANEGLLKGLSAFGGNARSTVYAGVFAVDSLRPQAQLIRRLKAAGMTGVINFPSISFIDGEAGAVFEELSFGTQREVGFLQACSKAGLRIAGVTRSREMTRMLVALGVDFLIAHGGPPTQDDPDPSQQAAVEARMVAQEHDVPVIPMSCVGTGRGSAQSATTIPAIVEANPCRES